MGEPGRLVFEFALLYGDLRPQGGYQFGVVGNNGLPGWAI